MIIIFIGADDSGKTHIAQELSRQLQIPYYKNSHEHAAFQNGELQSMTRFVGPVMVDFLRQTGYSIILDRGPQCEFAYARAYGREYDADIIRQIDQQYSQLGAILIYCNKHYSSYSDELVDFSMISKIKNEYQIFLKLTKCKYIYLDTTDENLERQILVIRNELRVLESKIA